MRFRVPIDTFKIKNVVLMCMLLEVLDPRYYNHCLPINVKLLLVCNKTYQISEMFTAMILRF